MSDLKKLLRLKGVSLRAVARQYGIGYHSLQKTFKGRRKSRKYQAVIAEYFGTRVEALFGPASSDVIRYLMEKEIDRHGEHRKEALRKEFLGE